MKVVERSLDRKNVKVSWGVKKCIEDVKSILKFKTESQAIAYMFALFEKYYWSQSVSDHERMLTRAEELERQGTLMI